MGSKKGDRKYGRNASKCDKYRKLRKHELSHINRIEKHLEKYGRKDKQAIEALGRYRIQLRTV